MLLCLNAAHVFLLYYTVASCDHDIKNELRDLLGNCACFCRLLIVFNINFCEKNLSEIQSECQIA